jgi:ABC-type transport system involved in multi-copper enzyme maturation permease subunit
MIDMVKADLLKLRRRRGLWWSALILPGTLAMIVGILGVVLTKADIHGGANFLNDGEFIIGFVTGIIIVIVGARLGSEEHALGTFRYQALTGVPRMKLYGSKVLALVLAAVVVTAVATLVTLVASFLPPLDGHPATGVSDVLKLYGGLLLPASVYGMIAFGIGALARSTGPAIAIALFLQLAGLNIIYALAYVWDGFRYAAVGAAIQRLTSNDLDPEVQMSIVAAIASIAVWVGLLAGLGALRTKRTEI